MSEAPPLSIRQRVIAWDAALSAARAYFRGRGLAEVCTPVRLAEVAIEPFIEPVAADGGLLATSPELPMKTLVAAGAGPVFQIAPVLRAGERGGRHREEFRLVEWYRPGDALAILQRDVEALVEAVLGAVGRVLGRASVPRRWTTVAWLDVFAATTGVVLGGDEDAARLRAALPELVGDGPMTGAADVDDLAAWTALFSGWSDACFDPWLTQRRAEGIAGVHVVEFPPPLAALSRVGAPQVTETAADGVALRIEAHVDGVEVANGYCELTDPIEQRRRFEAVAGLRAAYDQPALPMPESFLATLSDLPETVGCALGLDRLVMLACGQPSLSGVALLDR